MLPALIACSHRKPRHAALRVAAPSASQVPARPPKVAPRASAAPAPAVPPRGSVSLVVQRVSSVCWTGSRTWRSYLGTDLLVEERGAGRKKPVRDYVFCPKHAADGGATRPKLNTWRMCRAYRSCKIVASDGGGAADQSEVECGKVHVILKVVGGKTILEGPFGQRVVAPYPMHIQPTQRQSRDALVDC